MSSPHFTNTPADAFSRRADRCSFKTFWVGYTDWWAERFLPDAEKSDRSASPPTSTKAVQFLLLGLLIIATPVMATVFASMAAGTMSAMGTRAVAVAAQVGAVLVGLGFFIGLPVWAGWRTKRFCKTMCLRGHDILAGRRTRVRLL